MNLKEVREIIASEIAAIYESLAPRLVVSEVSMGDLRQIVLEELAALDEAKKKGAVKKRKYKGKTYKASKGMTNASSWDDKVKQASSWADDPEAAAAAAAAIVKTGKPAGKEGKKKSKKGK